MEKAKALKTAILSVRLKPSTKSFLEREAESQGRSVGNLVELLIADAARRAQSMPPSTEREGAEG